MCLPLAQELDLDAEILVLLEGVPMSKTHIGPPSVAQAEDEARLAMVHVGEIPEALDALDVASREAIDAGIKHMEHMAELIEAADGGKPCGVCRFRRHASNLGARPRRRHGVHGRLR